MSVIVATYNPGPGFDDLIASLDRQTLSHDEFEVLLCDDGSDAATRARLDAVAASRPYVRVLHLPHTGWPGTPRNHGIDVARGRYVFFSDHDDRFIDGALKSLADYADRNSSDVVIGRVVGVGRKIPRAIFRRDIPRAVLGEDPLLELLTPHKLFRTQFLRDNGIRFPDGRVRLEDHLFVMRAYFRASTISVLASTPCYAWLKNAGSASSSRIDPATYFPHLETVLDLVEDNTEPGPLRDTLLRHWYRGKILQRLDARRLVRYPDEYRERFLDVVVPLVRRRFGPGVDAGLAFPLRLRSALLRADRRRELLALARFETELGCRVPVVAARWTRTGRLVLTLDVRVTRDDADAFVFDRDGATAVWRPPAELGLDDLPPELFDASRDLRHTRIELFLREGSGTDRRVAEPPATAVLPAAVTVDPLRAFARTSRSLGGQLIAKVRFAGFVLEAPVSADAAALASLRHSPLLAGHRYRLVRRADGTVELVRDGPSGGIRDLGARVARRAERVAKRVRRRLRRRRPRG